MLVLRIDHYVSLLIFASFYLLYLVKFQYYSKLHRTRVIGGLFIVALITKLIDGYLVILSAEDTPIESLITILPLYSCDIGLFLGIVMLILHVKNPEKDYYTIDRFLVYMMFFNSLIPFVIGNFDFSPERYEKALKAVTSPVPQMYSFNNSLVHSLYLCASLLYARHVSLFNRSTKGFWKCLVIYAGITLVVHIINLILDAGGIKAGYMYTLNSEYVYRDTLEAIFGIKVGNIIVQLTQLPIIEDYFGALFIYYFGITSVYIVHIFIYRYNKKRGFDNLFYNKLIYPNDTLV